MTIATILKPISKWRKEFAPLLVDSQTGEIMAEEGLVTEKKSKSAGGKGTESSGTSVGFLIFTGIMALFAIVFFTIAVVHVFKEHGTGARSMTLRGNRTIFVNTTGVKNVNDTDVEKESSAGVPFKVSLEIDTDTDGDTIRKTVWDMTVFEHGYEIEAQNQWEMLDLPSVPSLSVQQSAKIVYDFVNNYTAILDQEEKVCYLLEMDQNVTKRPGDPDRDTFCKCNTEWIGYSVCMLEIPYPAVDNYTRYGPFPVQMFGLGSIIDDLCWNYATFFLVPVSEKTQKKIDDRSRRDAKERPSSRFIDLGGGLRFINVVKSV